jgi:hypothetical protein
MSEETFDHEEDGFTFSDEDFGRRYFSEQKSRPADQQAKPNTAPGPGGGNSFMRALRRRLAAARTTRSS